MTTILLKATNLPSAIVQGAITFIILGAIIWILAKLISKFDKKDRT